MSVRTETLQLRVLIDGSPARRELATLDQEYAKLNAGLKDMRRNTAEYVAATQRMDTIRQRQAELRKEIGLTGLTAKQLGDELRRLQVAQRNLTPNTAMWAENAQRIEDVKQRLRELNDVNVRAAAAWGRQRESIKLTAMTMEQLEMEAQRLRTALRTMDPNTVEFRNLNRELRMVDDRMTQLRNNLTPLQALWRNVKQEMSGVLGLATAAFAGGLVVNKMREWVRASAELSDAQADVRKTTGLTQQEVEALTRQLGQLNTRTARSELLQLARDAGKLGLAKEELLGFVRAGDQINVALGEDLGEDAIKTIGKLSEQFKVTTREGFDLERSMLGIGSALNELGASSTADEAFLVDFTSRMAGVATQANISIENIMGLAATLDQLGQRSETSSTALAQFTLKAFSNTGEYAKIAGMEVADFTALLGSDTNEALLRVLEGLNGNNEGLGRMTGLFSDLGQEGARAVGVLASVASNTKMLREQQAIANKAMADGVSVTQEFATKNSTLAADLDIIGKRLAAAFVNSGVVNALKSAVSSVREWVETPLSRTLEEDRLSMNMLYAQILQYNEGSDERIRLIKELQARYPEYLGNLNAETVSNRELGLAVKELNEQLVNKIILQRQEEKIAKQQKVQADTMEDLLEREADVRSRMVKLAEKYNLPIKEGVSLLEQSRDILQQVRAIEVRPGTTGGGMFAERNRLGHAIVQLAAVEKFLATEAQRTNKLFEEREALLERLGMNRPTAGSPTPGAGTPTGGAPEGEGFTPGPSMEAQEKMRQQMEAWRKELEDWRERLYQDSLSAEERDLRQLDVKHANELARLKANQLATQDDLRALEAQQAQERADLIAAQGQERLDGYSEAAERIRQATLDNATREMEDEVAKWDALIALGQKYGLDVSQLEEARQKALDAIRTKWRDKELSDQEKADAVLLAARVRAMQDMIGAQQGVGTMLAGMNAMLQGFYAETEERSWEHTQRARVLAIMQMKIASAVAITEAVKSIMADPTAPWFVKAGYIATAAGQVMAAVASAWRILGGTGNMQRPGATGATTTGGTPTNMPTGAKGGVFEGPLHSGGGLQVWDPVAGRQVAEVEGGEPWMVLSRAFRAQNADLIPLLMQASATGRRLPMGQRGGIFGAVPRFNFRTAADVLGGSTAAKGKGDGLNGSFTLSEKGRRTDHTAELLQEMRAMNRRLQSIEGITASWPMEVKAVASVKDLNRRQAELAELEDRNRAGSTPTRQVWVRGYDQ